MSFLELDNFPVIIFYVTIMPVINPNLNFLTKEELKSIGVQAVITVLWFCEYIQYSYYIASYVFLELDDFPVIIFYVTINIALECAFRL